MSLRERPEVEALLRTVRAEASAMPAGQRMSPATEEVRRLAATLPAKLRRQRALLMLAGPVRKTGLREVQCPGCRGRGREGDGALTPCALCLGFKEVPEGIALWVRSMRAPARPIAKSYRIDAALERAAEDSEL